MGAGAAQSTLQSRGIHAERPVRLKVNRVERELLVRSDATLLSVLRDGLGLTGTKGNCLESECGVCTVLLDGKAVNACIVLAARCEGLEITTIEGLGVDRRLDPLQEAFQRHGAVQCGYCIPGMILTARSYLDENSGRIPTREEVREGIAGTLCRCTGYNKIVDAIIDVASRRAGS